LQDLHGLTENLYIDFVLLAAGIEAFFMICMNNEHDEQDKVCVCPGDIKVLPKMGLWSLLKYTLKYKYFLISYSLKQRKWHI
jgi:hypothetical protein